MEQRIDDLATIMHYNMYYLLGYVAASFMQCLYTVPTKGIYNLPHYRCSSNVFCMERGGLEAKGRYCFGMIIYKNH